MCKHVLVAAMLLWSCKGKTNATSGNAGSAGSAGSAAATGSASGGGSGSGSAVAVAATADAGLAAAPAAPLVLAFNDKEENPVLLLAFDKKVPKLPAISPDGTLIADYQDDSGGPGMMPPPMHVAIRRVDGKGDPESIVLVDMDTAVKADGQDWAETPPAAPIVAQLKERGAKALARLQGFGTLDAVAIDGFGEPAPVKLDDKTLTWKLTDDEALELALAVPGAPPRRSRIESYGAKDCTFRPMITQALTHPAKTAIYVEVRYRFRDDCGEQPPTYVAWPIGANGTLTPLDEVAKLTTTQLHPKAPFAADAQIINPRGITPAGTLPFAASPDGDDGNLNAEVSRDGNSAWTSLTKKGAWRASSVMVKTKDGWKIAALDLTEPKDNAAVNRDAKAGKLPALPALAGDPGDAGLRAAFAKLTTDGITEGYEELVGIGSGPGEITHGGASFAKAWNAAWKGKVTIGSSVARLAPSGTTGWVVANIELAKKGYKIPFQVFCVFDKDASGAWTLVHIHFAV